MLRKIAAAALILLQIFTCIGFAAGADMTMLDKTGAVEQALYGAVQTGSLVDRIEKIEKDLFGTVSKVALVNKVDKAYTYTIENSVAAPSLLVKMNGVEWTLTRSVTAQAIQSRLENVERTITGNAETGSIDARMNKLLKMAFTGGNIELDSTSLEKDSLVKIKLVTPLGTKQSRVGDIVEFRAAADMFAGGILIIPQGARGEGKVTKVEPARNFGRDAKLEVSFESIQIIDGTSIPTVLGDKAKKETQSMATAAGASVAGMIILGPVGVIGGAFVNGKDVNIPAGTELYIQTKNETQTLGMRTK